MYDSTFPVSQRLHVYRDHAGTQRAELFFCCQARLQAFDTDDTVTAGTTKIYLRAALAGKLTDDEEYVASIPTPHSGCFIELAEHGELFEILFILDEAAISPQFIQFGSEYYPLTLRVD